MVRSGGVIWTIIELEEDIMVLKNVTKFHKILIKSNRLRERMSLDRRMDMRTKVLRPYVQVDGWTGVTLNAPAIVMGGA